MGENGNSNSIDEGECESVVVVSDMLFGSRRIDDDGRGIGTPRDGIGTVCIVAGHAVGYHDETLDVDHRCVGFRTYFAPRSRPLFGTSSIYSVVAIRSYDAGSLSLDTLDGMRRVKRILKPFVRPVLS